MTETFRDLLDGARDLRMLIEVQPEGSVTVPSENGMIEATESAMYCEACEAIDRAEMMLEGL